MAGFLSTFVIILRLYFWLFFSCGTSLRQYAYVPVSSILSFVQLSLGYIRLFQYCIIPILALYIGPEPVTLYP